MSHLSLEALAGLGRVTLAVTTNVSTLDVLHGDVLYIESNVVTRGSLGQGLMVHLNRLHLSGDHGGSKGHHHTRLEDSSLNTTHGDRSNTYKHMIGQLGNMQGKHKVSTSESFQNLQTLQITLRNKNTFHCQGSHVQSFHTVFFLNCHFTQLMNMQATDLNSLLTQ